MDSFTQLSPNAHKYNKTAAFVEYARGTALTEVAHAFAIPISTVERWAKDEKWGLMVSRMPVLMPQAPDPGGTAERAMARIKENRERNLVVAQKLQQDLMQTVDKLLSGELKVERVFANGSQVSMDPGIRDRQDLALYAKHVADLSYRALGDVESTRGMPEGGGSQGGQITIILPGVVAQPREKRAQVVDVEMVKVDNREDTVISHITDSPVVSDAGAVS